MTPENKFSLMFVPYSTPIRPSLGQSGMKFDFWLNFQIKIRNKFN